MARSTQYVCVKDRQCFSVHDLIGGSWHCPICGEPGMRVYYTWRPPKKNDDRAWALIEKGDLLWDKNAIIKKELKRLGYEWGVRRNRQRHIEDAEIRKRRGTDEKVAKFRSDIVQQHIDEGYHKSERSRNKCRWCK